MNEKINQFLDSVCRHIRYKPVHQDIRDELAVHVNELKEEYLKQSQNEETALDAAITAMGDCREIGRQLDKRHKTQTDWLLIGLTAIIAGIGCIVMFASSHFESLQAVDFKKYIAYAILGIAVMAGFFFFDYTKLKRLALPLYLLSFTLLMLIIEFGGQVHGARRFITIAAIRLSTELTTLFFLISFAGFIDKARGKGFKGIFKLLILSLVSIVPVSMQPNFSQVCTMLAGYAVLIISAVIKNHFGGSRKRQLFLLGIIACLFGAVFFTFIISQPYRSGRISSFLSRGQSDPNGIGYQQIMADKWLAASKLFGTSGEKVNGRGIDMAPSITTDYVLINVFATLGRIAGTALVIIIAVYIIRMFVTVRKIKNSYGFYLSLASCTVLAAQYVTGILLNFNLYPPTSVNIPFISYGGTGYIVCMAFVGMILSVWRRNNLIAASSQRLDLKN